MRCPRIEKKVKINVNEIDVISFGSENARQKFPSPTKIGIPPLNPFISNRLLYSVMATGYRVVKALIRIAGRIRTQAAQSLFLFCVIGSSCLRFGLFR